MGIVICAGTRPGQRSSQALLYALRNHLVLEPSVAHIVFKRWNAIICHSDISCIYTVCCSKLINPLVTPSIIEIMAERDGSISSGDIELDDSSENELNGTSSASEDDGDTEPGTTDSEQMSQVSMQV